MARNHLNVFKRSNDPWNFPNFDMTIVLVHIKCRINVKAIRGSYLPFVIKHALFPLGTTNLLVSCSGLWGGCVQTFVKQDNFFYHIILVAWHYVKQGFMCFWSFFLFFGIWMAWRSMHVCPDRDTNMFENSFQFTAHGINLYSSSQTYDFSNRYG